MKLNKNDLCCFINIPQIKNTTNKLNTRNFLGDGNLRQYLITTLRQIEQFSKEYTFHNEDFNLFYVKISDFNIFDTSNLNYFFNYLKNNFKIKEFNLEMNSEQFNLIPLKLIKEISSRNRIVLNTNIVNAEIIKIIQNLKDENFLTHVEYTIDRAGLNLETYKDEFKIILDNSNIIDSITFTEGNADSKQSETKEKLKYNLSNKEFLKNFKQIFAFTFYNKKSDISLYWESIWNLDPALAFGFDTSGLYWNRETYDKHFLRVTNTFGTNDKVRVNELMNFELLIHLIDTSTKYYRGYSYSNPIVKRGLKFIRKDLINLIEKDYFIEKDNRIIYNFEERLFEINKIIFNLISTFYPPKEETKK